MKMISILCLCIVILIIGCRKQPVVFAQGWSAPTQIAESDDSLGGGLVLYKWHKSIFALKSQRNGVAKCFLLNSNDSSWAEVPFTGVPHGYLWYRPAIDQNGDKVFFEQNYTENDQLVISLLLGQIVIKNGLSVQGVTEKKWIIGSKALFGKTSNVRLTERPGTRGWPIFGIGVIDGPDLNIPFSLGGFTINEKGVAVSRGPYVNGIFHSTNSGETWRIERTFDFQAWSPSVCRSDGRCYYFAVKGVRNQKDQLWFTQKPSGDNSWANPETITKTYGSDYIAMPQYDTVHLFWLDARHEKRTGNPVYPYAGNYEVTYSQRKDSDADWSKEVNLSKGLLYSYRPSVSVEGDKIVVAWAGVQTAGVWHAPHDPNDIFYVTSRDKGNTWTKPLRVTDNIKAGVTAGDPQVVLLNGIIHLTYIQGKLNLKRESPGLTKLNQPPWPIYYTQRPFPD
jgi:hypothetical protein